MTVELDLKIEDARAWKEKYSQLTESYQKLKERNHQMELDLTTYRDENHQIQNQVLTLHDKEHDMADKIAAMKLTHVQTLQSMEANHTRERKQLENQYNTQLHDLRTEIELKQMEYGIKVASLQDELSTAKRSLDEKVKALDDEKADAAALRLRLQLLESQMSSFKQRRERDAKEEFSSSSSAFGLLSDHHPRSSYPPINYTSHSPAFSEDMGPASVSKLSVPTYEVVDPGISLDDLLIQGGNQVSDDKLVEENEKLKRIIKEVRSDTCHSYQHLQSFEYMFLDAFRHGSFPSCLFISIANERAARN